MQDHAESRGQLYLTNKWLMDVGQRLVCYNLLFINGHF